MSLAKAPMVMTILDARVPESRWDDLRDAYAEATQSANGLEPGLVSTFLVQSASDREAWRILTVWESRAALDAMRAAGPPRGPMMFRAAGAEPALSIWDVAGHVDRPG